MKRQSERMQKDAQNAAFFTTEADKLLVALSKKENDGKVIKVPVSCLSTTSNVRTDIPEDEKFEALLESISEYGLLQPLVVSKHQNLVSVVAGHRRLKAIKKLDIEVVPVLLKIFDNDEDRTVTQLVENLVREDLEPVDHAEAIAKLKSEEKVSAAKLARLIGYNDRKIIERLCKVAAWDNEAKQLARELQIALHTLGSIAMKSDAKGEKLIEYIKNASKHSGKGKRSRKGASSFDEKTRNSIDHWFANTEVSKEQKSKFKTVAKVFNNLEPQSREMLRDLLDSVWS